MADEPFNCNTPVGTDNAVAVVSAQLAGVPAVLRIPKVITRPPIVLWHGFGPPASQQALMDALPLDELPAVKVYLGVPLFGARAPAGGVNESDLGGSLERSSIVLGAGAHVRFTGKGRKDAARRSRSKLSLSYRCGPRS
jgi:hypothetical protein